MSTCEYETRGYGIQMPKNFKKNTTEDKIRAMLERAPKLKTEILECFKEWEIDYEYATLTDFDDYVEIHAEQVGPGIAYLMAQVLNEIHDDDFMETVTDDDGDTFLFFCRLMPWEMTDFEKELTPEHFDKLLNEVYCILYDGKVVSDDVSVRTFG